MKFSTVLLATCLIAFTTAQFPCHDFGWNGAISNCASCNVGGVSGANVWGSITAYSVCTNCTVGFFLNQSACIPCTNNCTACYSNGACKSTGCAYGYAYMPTNSTCVACPAGLNCAQCAYSTNGNSFGYLKNGPFACTACVNNGYYISATGACTACPTGCASAAITNGWSANGACPGGVCGSCGTGYLLVSGSCSACGTGCSTCSAVGTCTACLSTAYYIGAGSTCTACTVTNCATCQATAAATCDACATGYYLASNVCTACPTGCASCSSATVCSTCSAGYYFPATGTLCTAATAAQSANCTANVNYNAGTPSATIGYCSSCAVNTTLSTIGTCVPCPSNCTTCALASSTATTSVCLQCQLGFGLNDTTGNCVPCPPNCDYCDGSGVCTQCRQGVWNSFFPTVSAINSNAPGLTAVASANLAFYVSQGFYLPPNQCQQCPYNCSACANSTFCFNNCTKNYMYNSTLNLCLPNGASRIVIAGFAFLGALFYFI